MKKVLLIITLFLLLPTTTLAKTYELKNSEIIISFDDENWTVATRENVRNSSLVKKYNMNYKDIESLLEKNSAYAYAINNDNVKKILEFFVVSPEISFGYDDNQINEFGEILVEETGADSYTIYENDYKYIKIEYYDFNSKVYLLDYHTIVNSNYYVFKAQKNSEFNEEEKQQIKEIIDNVIIQKVANETNFKIDWIDAITKSVSYMIGVAIACFIIRKINIKNNKNES